MGIVFNTKPTNYNNKPQCANQISQRPTLKVLTRQNAQLLKNLGLKIKRGGKKL